MASTRPPPVSVSTRMVTTGVGFTRSGGQQTAYRLQERTLRQADRGSTTVDVKLRKEMYTEVDSIVNDECVFIYHHSVPLTGATVKPQRL